MAPRPPGVPRGASSYVKKSSGAHVRRVDQFSWEPLKDGDLLYEGDKVDAPRGSSPILRSGGKDDPMTGGSLRQVGPRRVAKKGPVK